MFYIAEDPPDEKHCMHYVVGKSNPEENQYVDMGLVKNHRNFDNFPH